MGREHRSTELIVVCGWCGEELRTELTIKLTNYARSSTKPDDRSTMLSVKTPTHHHDCPGPAPAVGPSLTSLPSGAASDATSGVPGHREVSEAARSPQEPAGVVCKCPPEICRCSHATEGNTP